MEDTTDTRLPAAMSALLAGLQAGMLGAFWMLAWLGISATWQDRGFWNPENLFSTAFYGGDAVHSNFGWKTFPGLALFLLIYSSLGGIFALLTFRRFRAGLLMLVALIFSVVWFYVSFYAFCKTMLPLVYLLSPERPMLIGHVIYGLCLGRFPAHDPNRPPDVDPVALARTEAVLPELPPPDSPPAEPPLPENPAGLDPPLAG